MEFREVVEQARASNNIQLIIDEIPYASLIGVECELLGHDVIFKLPFSDDNIGNPILPAIHGGVIGGFMELGASLHLLMFLDTLKMPKIIDFSLDYIRAGKARATFAECKVTRQGSRVANVVINAWQTHRSDPIATARCHFLLE
jgi:acyl-coenzyme A thioesterase PaaI-like protein